MNLKNKFIVESIKSKETHDWLLNKHYSKRIPSISYAFGLFRGTFLFLFLALGAEQMRYCHTFVINIFTFISK